MNTVRLALVVLVLASFAAGGAYAGPYTDDLSKCLVESTTPQDRADLVKWMFAAASLHPAVRSLASVSTEQLNDANKKTADLVVRLLADSCRQETQKALKYEGQMTLQASFQVLGQVAGKELFTSPEVATALSGLEDYLDVKKLESLNLAP